jgi:hypothetical protein
MEGHLPVYDRLGLLRHALPWSRGYEPERDATGRTERV